MTSLLRGNLSLSITHHSVDVRRCLISRRRRRPPLFDKLSRLAAGRGPLDGDHMCTRQLPQHASVVQRRVADNSALSSGARLLKLSESGRSSSRDDASYLSLPPHGPPRHVTVIHPRRNKTFPSCVELLREFVNGPDRRASWPPGGQAGRLGGRPAVFIIVALVCARRRPWTDSRDVRPQSRQAAGARMDSEQCCRRPPLICLFTAI